MPHRSDLRFLEEKRVIRCCTYLDNDLTALQLRHQWPDNASQRRLSYSAFTEDGYVLPRLSNRINYRLHLSSSANKKFETISGTCWTENLAGLQACNLCVPSESFLFCLYSHGQ